MLAALLIVFREVFEAGLIVGIVLAATRPITGSGWWIAAGVLGGVVGASLTAVFARALSMAFAGVGQELFVATILAIAAAMLTWHNVWMARHGRKIAAEMRAVGHAVLSGAKSLAGLAIVVGLAVLREGFEVVLFLYGVIASEADSGPSVLAGGLIGLVLGSSICALTYLGLLSIPNRYLFKVTSILIAFLAAGMAAQATMFLERADIVTALPQMVWDSSWVISDSSLLGRALRTLIGYIDRPTAMELVVYVSMLIGGLSLIRVLAPVAGSVRVART